MKYLKKILCSLFIKLGVLENHNFLAKTISDQPLKESLSPNCIYIVGGPGYQKWAYFRCPCNCSEIIMLCLSENKKPSWSVAIDF